MARRHALLALVAATALTLAGCGGGSDSSEPGGGGSDTSSSTGTSSSPGGSSTSGAVDGVQLTPEGARLKLGDTAKVSWQPDQKTTGVLAVSVTGLFKVPISAFSAWRLRGETRGATPYFVHVSVRNIGESDLSHVPVPLYLLDERESLLEASTFKATFTPCPSKRLPADFKPGAKTSVCLVYFVPRHGQLIAISFRPTEDFDAITWVGDVVSGGGRQHKNQHKKKH